MDHCNEADNEVNDDGLTVRHLRIEEWDAPTKSPGAFNRSQTSESGSGCDSPGPRKKQEKKHRAQLTFEEVNEQVGSRIQILLKREDFTQADARADLKFIQRQTRYSPDVGLNRRVADRIVKCGIGHVYLRVWQSVSSVEYLQKENFPAYKNLQTVLSIVWNCSDKSVGLCDALVRAGVIHLFLSELDSCKLKDSDLSDENKLYLVKAYLGILHNIIRLCSDSRKVFRASDAVEVLQGYVAARQGLVKTKAYLILSYLITEDENGVINATDDNIAFIISILKEALSSENHFSKTHAFWASEIACGMNHLAVNDLNKVRMGRLGAFPLYLQMLQSNSIEEQNLATAGLWILAFKDENKHLLKRLPGCLEVLQSLSINGPQESIRRAARGALWVIRSAPDRPEPVQAVLPDDEETWLKLVDTEAPHIMVSYHWSNQEMMISVKEALKAHGFKVWMDVDNMSGSTLEAMALAVERSSVILVCMSQGYKDSPSCRTEAEYIYRLRKDIVPLLLQTGYDPDGWLGMMVGTKLYFDFSSRDRIGGSIQRLVKELGNRGRLGVPQPDVVDAGRTSSPSVSCRLPAVAPASTVPSTISKLNSSFGGSTSSFLQESCSATSLHSYYGKMPMLASHWNKQDVQLWLENQRLKEALGESLSGLDGELLLQYRKMMDKAPQYFYHSLESFLHLDLTQILQFSKALEDLK
ncbi:hypothetical protein CAPTEDRAFT_225602 [Capitella teleta]|uniref:TIR domain-containing protein n=1 Tax=Capitella teleta TaxID=283909 RepID=R7UCG9_CAPTE|nr:hypothetical protein CAPTEDRAFT_225602 [Capitella teleta]|eukprot:ELU04075.1 hypothetical protein CAPTEDRAFT_225602 [Capitella teleta]